MAWHCDSIFQVPKQKATNCCYWCKINMKLVFFLHNTWEIIISVDHLTSGLFRESLSIFFSSFFTFWILFLALSFPLSAIFPKVLKKRNERSARVYWLRPSFLLTMTDIDCEIFTITQKETITFLISVSEICNLLFFFIFFFCSIICLLYARCFIKIWWSKPSGITYYVFITHVFRMIF